ncbi:Sugar kinase of the NBD/HSP70 family, may contain an N-terminal HTH domain [Alkalibacterium subtropicum]|uniref:Sugar kinase of the NBD/HSP70 family, may contain an N-terminal HTH domain n=1 Tax=Alkalibacterium subtropicum TaxID=753702 RepID=A0A1I1GFB5_9LACT|nr:ROK family protein [Alkalibacterium subtropicum]SFC10146.1 Sugar kinase of the NBD/HSP70 family, may contain an N-terminal HTH domain [Alkalibacterium subtropicum]
MNKTCTLGIDVGGTNIKSACVYADGMLDNKQKVPSPGNLKGFLETIDEICRQVDMDSVEAVAMSLPGKVDSEKGIVYFGGSLKYLHTFNFKTYFKETYGKRCTIINDGKAAALCELWLGNLQGVKDGIAIILGTGVGGGVIIDGKLHQGNTFQAGELSFITKNPFDPNKNNIIGYELSAVDFIARCGEMLRMQKPYDGEKVFEAINRKNNPALNALFSAYITRLLNLIVNLQAILNMEKVLIGGGISAQPIVLEELKRQYAELRTLSPVFGTIFEPLVIDTCAFKNNSNILGAVYASMH